MSIDLNLLESSFSQLMPHAQQLADRFDAQLVAACPHLRSVFRGDKHRQKMALLGAMGTIVQTLRHPERLDPAMADLVRRHAQYGVRPEHFHAVGPLIIQCIADTLGPAWTPAHQHAWTAAFDVIDRAIVNAMANPRSAA